MNWIVVPGLLAGAVCASLLFPARPAPSADSTQDPQEMAEVMAKAKRYTQPGEHHLLLKRFLGSWDTETRIFMGGQATPPAKGTAEAVPGLSIRLWHERACNRFPHHHSRKIVARLLATSKKCTHPEE